MRIPYQRWSTTTLSRKLREAREDHAAVRVRKRQASAADKIVLRNRLWTLRKKIRQMTVVLFMKGGGSPQ